MNRTELSSSRRNLPRILRAAALVLGGLVPAAAAIATATAAPPVPKKDGITGRSGKQGTDCNACHSGGTAPTVALTGPLYVLKGSTRTYNFKVSGGQMAGAGLNVAVDDGDLVATDSETYLDNDELTHSTPRSVDSAGEAQWDFDWVAPTTPGPVKLWAAGNSVNLNNRTSGDKPALTTLTVDVVDSLVSFSEFGTGLAGSGGFVPHLSGIDGPTVGPWSVEITDGRGGAFSLLWASTTQTTFPLYGGTFYVDLTTPLLILPLTLGGTPGQAGAGVLSLDGDDLTGFAPLTAYLQLMSADIAAPKKISLSNALELDLQ